MKKRILAFLLAVVLLTSCFVAVRADYRVSFIAINDTLPSELVNVQSSYGGAVYVPYWLFSSYLGFSYVYSGISSQATLYYGESSLTFDMATGKCYDGDGYYYTASAIMRSGCVYLPLRFVQAYFTCFTISVISESIYGDVTRLKTGAEVLSDSKFISAARIIMRNHWLNSKPPEASAEPSAPAVETPGIHEGTELSLSFVGIPDQAIFSTLSSGGVSACFFLTARDVESSADLVRRMACEGHSLGVRCTGDPAEDYRLVSSLIFEAARVRTILISAPDELEEAALDAAGELGLVYCRAELDLSDLDTTKNAQNAAYTVTSALDAHLAGGSLLLPGSLNPRSLSIILGFLADEKYSLSLLREV